MLESIVEIRKIEIPSTKSLKEDIEKLSETIENTQGPELLKAMKKRLEELKKSLALIK